MSLISILAIVAVAISLVTLMLDSELPALDQAGDFYDAGQALAIARGGELTAIAALRRDLVAAPESDNATEPWVRIAQPTTSIGGGTFALEISDAQSRFNVNDAVGASEPTLAVICGVLGINPDVASRIARTIVESGRIRDLGELARAGIDETAISRLRTHLTALPASAPINLNFASPVLLAALVGDRVGGRVLADRRDRAGKLTALDFAATNLRMPQGAGFTSDHFIVTTTVRQGRISTTLTSLIERRRGPSLAVVAIARWIGNPPI